MDKITEYLTIKEAAEFLGISPSTLRNWEKQGKLSTHRNPVNSYRLYRKRDLEQFLKLILNSRTAVNKQG